MSGAPSPTASAIVEPIDNAAREHVITLTHQYIAQAVAAYSLSLEPMNILFDLKGRAAGMYRLKTTKGIKARAIRYNPWIFAKYFDDNCQNTIPHEVAHYIVEQRFGWVKPHGSQWRAVMALFQVDASVRCDYDLTGIPLRQSRRIDYQCECRLVPLTHYRHQQIQQGLSEYRCRECRAILRLR